MLFVFSVIVFISDRRFAGDDGDTQEKEELERVKQILRKVRSDPPIAPDEPVPITLRPFDVKPGDASSDIKFVYKHALSTVHDVKRQMAVRRHNPEKKNKNAHVSHVLGSSL